MNCTRLFASLTATAVLSWAAACSAPKDDETPKPDASANGGSGGTAGSGTGGDGGTATTGGSSGESGAGNGGTQGSGATDGGTPDGSAGDAGTQGSGGTSGASGSGGSAGSSATGGSAGTLGSAGSAGTSASGGTAGTGGTCQTNTQTDGENCGRCNHSCGGGRCRSGHCEPVVVLDTQRKIPGETVPNDPTNEALINQDTLYYWNKGYPAGGDYSYDIVRASVVPTMPPATGTIIQSLPLDPSLLIKAVHFDSGYLYYTQPTGVYRKKLDTTDGTGAGTKVFTLDTGRVWGNLTIAGGKAYVAGEVDTNMIDLIKTAVFSIALPVANAATKPTLIAGLGTLGDRISDLTVVNGHIFWLQYDRLGTTHNLLWTAPVTGGTPVQLDDVGNAVGSSILGEADGTYVYWNTGSVVGRVRRCPIAHLDTLHIEDLADANNAQEGMALDANYIYFMETPDVIGSPVYRAAKDGSGPQLLAGLPGGVQVVGVDDKFVYLTDFDGLVYRLSKEP